MERELILCIPGPWRDRADFIRQVFAIEPQGRFVFAGLLLADLQADDQVPIDFCDADPRMLRAFEVSAQGKLTTDCLERIGRHLSVVYLHLPLDLLGQRERILKFTQLMRQIGGIAVKVESTGVAHMWDRWERLLKGSAFDLYCSVITLVGDKQSFYSCGMHHFGLPECEVPSYVGASDGADLINRFNSWQLNERPGNKSGETISR